MAVQISDLEAILKNFYLGPIIEALNNQLEMVELFQKITVDWSGRQVVIPVHIARNSGTAFKPETGGLPTAGKQAHVDLNITAKYLYGRFSLTGPAIASAKTTANSFATYVQTEMEGLVTDTKIRANQSMWTGGGCVGFIHERANIAAGAPLATDTFAFTGNKDVLQTLQGLDSVGGVLTRLSVNIIRLDDYTLANAGVNVMVDADAGTPGQLVVTCGPASTVTLATMTGEFAAMIQVLTSGQVVLATGVYTADAVATPLCAERVNSEPSGIYANLGLQPHFGVNRATAANAPLRSTVQAIDVSVAANSTLNFKRMQALLDEIMVLGGDDPDCLYAHPSLRQEYSALLSFVSATNTSLVNDVNGKPGKGDPGFSGYAFNGIPLKMSRHCGKGLLVFLNTKVWAIAELKSFGMADMDGNVLSRVASKDEWEGFVSWYYNMVCKQPNRCAILTGIIFPGQ